MTTLSFDLEQSYGDEGIFIAVGLLADASGSVVEMKLDTGAAISTMHHSYLELLGIDDIASGASATLFLANGDGRPAWIHPVRINFFGVPLTIDVAFCPEWSMENLLGMRGVYGPGDVRGRSRKTAVVHQPVTPNCSLQR